MNAHELADELEKRHLLGGYASQAATMLRQLQAEKELLQAKLNYMFEQELKSAKVNR